MAADYGSALQRGDLQRTRPGGVGIGLVTFFGQKRFRRNLYTQCFRQWHHSVDAARTVSRENRIGSEDFQLFDQGGGLLFALGIEWTHICRRPCIAYGSQLLRGGTSNTVFVSGRRETKRRRIIRSIG